MVQLISDGKVSINFSVEINYSNPKFQGPLITNCQLTEARPPVFRQ